MSDRPLLSVYSVEQLSPESVDLLAAESLLERDHCDGSGCIFSMKDDESENTDDVGESENADDVDDLEEQKRCCCCDRRYKRIWVPCVIVLLICMLCWALFGPLLLYERIRLVTMTAEAFAKSDSSRMTDNQLWEVITKNQNTEIPSTTIETPSSNIPATIPRIVHKVFITRGKRGRFFEKKATPTCKNGGSEAQDDGSEDECSRRHALVGPYFSLNSAMIIPMQMIEIVETWKSLTTDVRLYDLEGCRKYIREKLFPPAISPDNVERPKMLAVFDRLSPFAFKSDFFRALVLLHDGGIYSDIGDDLADAEGLKKVLWGEKTGKQFSTPREDPVVGRSDLPEFLVFCDARKQGDAGTSHIVGHVQNTFIAATPGHVIMERTLRLAMWNTINRKLNLDQLSITGPGVLGRSIGFKDGDYCQRTPEDRQEFIKNFYSSLGYSEGQANRILIGDIWSGERMGISGLYGVGGSQNVLVQKHHPPWTNLKGNSYAQMWWTGTVFCSSTPSQEGLWCSIFSLFFNF